MPPLHRTLIGPHSDLMQSLTQSIDSRRLAMLKAMGVELWWAKTPAMLAPPAQAERLPVAGNPRTSVSLAKPLEAQAQGGLAQSAPQALKPEAQCVESAAQTISTPSIPTPAAVAELPASVATSPAETLAAAASSAAHRAAVCWTVPTRWIAQPGFAMPADSDAPALAAHSAASALPPVLLLVDDLQGLGDVQPAAMQLLENMLRAMGLAHSPALWLSWARRPSALAAPSAAAQPLLAATSVQQMLAQSGAQLVLAMGREAAQQWLGRTEPLGALRQDSHRAHGLPVVVTYSPVYLLRATHAKRQAWADLQRAMALLAEARSA